MVERLRVSRWRRAFDRVRLAADAWFDSTLYTAGQTARSGYEAYSALLYRFRTTGLVRVAVECACEGLTLGLAGGIVALVFATPAFQETSDDWLKKQDLAVTFLDRYGQEVGRRGIRHDDAVSFDQLPTYLIQAVIATEDRRFFEHFGIDVVGTIRALTVNARASNVRQGGSSITQQLAKNLFLSNERTLERKIKEAYLAVWLETHLSKREILSLYLDRVYMGGGTFGVQAASEFYFGKSVRELTLAEAAMLAGLFKAPTKYAPHINLPAARARANDVLNNMVDAGYLTSGQIFAAERAPATAVDRRRETSPDWYLDWAYDEVKRLAAANKLGGDRVLTVKTGLDVALQRHAETVIEDELRQEGPRYHAHQSATVILDPLGAVRAIVGGRDYGASQFNRAIDAQRQPGSSFKPFVYLTALLTGKFKPTTTVVDAPICIGNWCPHNYGGSYMGSLPLVSALTHSLNTVAVRLSIAIGNGNPKAGRAKIVQTARAMGLTTPLLDTPSLPIGADEVTVIDMASAYAAFANGGRRAPPYAAVEIDNSRGDVIYRRDRDGPPLRQVINADTITTMDGMLRQVVVAGTGRRAALEGIEVAGKTGTTNLSKDAWFVGFTGNLVAAVWFGNDDDSSMANLTGGALPAQTWHDIMEFAHRGIELKPMPGGTVAPAPPPAAQTVAASAPPRPPTLSHAAADALTDIVGAVAAARRERETRPGGTLSMAGDAPLVPGGARAAGGRIELR